MLVLPTSFAAWAQPPELPEVERIRPRPLAPDGIDLDHEIRRLGPVAARSPAIALRLAETLVSRSQQSLVETARIDEQALLARRRADVRASKGFAARRSGFQRALARDRLAAIAWLDAIARDRTAPMPDVVAGALALLEQELALAGDERGSVEAAHRLVGERPRSPDGVEATLHIAEVLFAAGDRGEAEAWYRRVVSTPGAHPEPSAYARYKLAWCRFLAADVQAALVEMEVARRLAEGLPAGRGRILAREAERDAERFRGR